MTPVNLFGLVAYLTLKNLNNDLASSPSITSNDNQTVTLNKTLLVMYGQPNTTTDESNETAIQFEKNSSVVARHALPALPYGSNNRKSLFAYNTPPQHAKGIYRQPLLPYPPPLSPVLPPLPPPVLPYLPTHPNPVYHFSTKKEYERLQVGYGTVFFNGKDAVLKCHFPSDTYMVSNVVWHKLDSPAFHDDYRHFESTYGHISVLSINDVNPKDFGIYSCVVTGGKRNAHPISLYQEVNFFPPNSLNYPHPYGRK